MIESLASLLALLVSVGAWSAEPVALLGRPGLPGRFQLLADGAIRSGEAGPVLTEWIAPEDSLARPEAAPSPSLSWLAPGVRVVKSEQSAGGLRLTTLSGADGEGPEGRQSLWLFRALRLAAEDGRPRRARLCIAIGRSGLALRDESALLDGEEVQLVVSQEPEAVQDAGAQTVLAFDLAVPAKGAVDLLVAAPAQPVPYRLRDVPDVRNLNPDFRLGEIVSAWEGRALPERLSVGSTRVTEAFHAAVGALLLDPPRLDDPALATSLSALARAGVAPQLPRLVETLVAGQAADGRFAGVTDLAVQADLTTALADCALFSEAPERWAPTLWRPVARSAALLEATQPRTPRFALALRRAGELAALAGDSARAEAFLALPPGEPAGPPASLFEARAAALWSAPESPDPWLSAYVAMHSSDAEQRQRGWEAAEALLGAQPLPGVTFADGHEDLRVAAAIVFLVGDAVARAEPANLQLLPAVPASWADGGALVQLDGFPSGFGPVSLTATSAEDGAVTLALPETPRLAPQVLLSPPLGASCSGLRANGKLLPRETFEGGPPWPLGPKTGSVVLLP